jgi:hypothetical protein
VFALYFAAVEVALVYSYAINVNTIIETATINSS